MGGETYYIRLFYESLIDSNRPFNDTIGESTMEDVAITGQ